MSLNKTKIEWCDFTWNPIVGCKHSCNYCYAKRMNDRFKWINDWNEPKFFRERLNDPYKLKKPFTIFVGSMCDLFGEWNNFGHISDIIDVCRDNKQHKFMFLTKNSGGYNSYWFPENCMLGLTLTTPEKDKYAEFVHYATGKKFLSIEPILGGGFDKMDLSDMDMVMVGAMTGPKSIKPKPEWVNGIKHHNVLYKNNLKL